MWGGATGLRVDGVIILFPRCLGCIALLLTVLQAGCATLSSDEPGNIETAPAARHADGDPAKRYLLLGPHPTATASAKGFGLIVIVPGGHGDLRWQPFVQKLFLRGIPKGYLAAQLVVPKWSDTQRIVWPVPAMRTPGMKFSSPEFFAAVINEIENEHPIDPSKIFLLAWSSGGLAAYVSTLTNSKVRGAVIAASIFKPEFFPPLTGAKGRSYYLLQSPEDSITPFVMAERARRELTAAGARVLLKTYPGGHQGAWTGEAFAGVYEAIHWLAEPSAAVGAQGGADETMRSRLIR